MLYRFLGILVWKAAKLFLRRRYGSTMAPKPLIVGLAVVLVAGVAAAVAALFLRDGSDDDDA